MSLVTGNLLPCNIEVYLAFVLQLHHSLGSQSPFFSLGSREKRQNCFLEIKLITSTYISLQELITWPQLNEKGLRNVTSGKATAPLSNHSVSLKGDMNLWQTAKCLYCKRTILPHFSEILSRCLCSLSSVFVLKMCAVFVIYIIQTFRYSFMEIQWWAKDT